MLDQLAGWLGRTQASDAIRGASWVIPTTQTIHLLCISVVVASVAMMDLRLMQLIRHPVSIARMAQRFLPWIWGALLLLAATGCILIVGEPRRELINPTFWVKMALIAIAAGVTLSFQLSLRRDVEFWELSVWRRAWARGTAAISLLLWLGVVVAGAGSHTRSATAEPASR